MLRRIQRLQEQERDVRVGKPPLAKCGWLCMHSDCSHACNDRYNDVMRRTCGGCGRLKAVAMSPPLTLSIKPREPTSRTLGPRREGGPEGRPAKKTQQPEGQNPAAGPKTSIKEMANADTQRAVARTFAHVVMPKIENTLDTVPTTTAEQRLGLTALQEVLPEKLFYQPPKALPRDGSVDDIVAKAQPLMDAEALAVKQAEVTELQNAYLCLSDSNPGKGPALEALDKGKAELHKMEKRAPGTRLMLARLKAAQQEHAAANAKWQQDADAGKVKAAARLQEFLSALDDFSAAIVARRKLVLDAHVTVSAEWSLFNLQRQQQEDKIRTQFDARIADLDKEVAADSADGAGSQPMAVDVPVPHTPPTLVADEAVLQYKKDIHEASEALAKLQRQVAQALADKQEAERKVAEVTSGRTASDTVHTFECRTADLPTLVPEPESAQWTDYYHLWAALESLEEVEEGTGMKVPVTFAHLQAGIITPRQLLGETIWTQAFPTEATPETIVSSQVIRLLHKSLRTHKDKLLHDKAQQEAAAQAVRAKIDAVVTDFRVKRLRADA